MANFLEWMNKTPLSMFVIFSLTLGLAPFTPPHIVEKLQMLFRGELVKPLDWFDLFFHAFPWSLLLMKLFLTWQQKNL
ncbi:MAG: RND transporter [SAR324 cluster bacterium]|nr:RND transporter [SAR324 cluster bacterium]